MAASVLGKRCLSSAIARSETSHFPSMQELAIIPEELAKVKATVTAGGEKTETYDQAAKIFEQMSLADDYPEFLTLPLYEAME